jgi:hypothetical protein
VPPGGIDGQLLDAVDVEILERLHRARRAAPAPAPRDTLSDISGELVRVDRDVGQEGCMAGEAKGKQQVEQAAEIGAEGIDQVRDILFGAQMRTVDRRLAQLETRFQKELETANKNLSKQIADVDARLKKQGESLGERLKAESAKRTEEVKALRSEMSKGLKDLERGIAKLDEATAKADAELRDQMLALGKTLSDDIRGLSERLSADIDRYTHELRSEKTDISSLVELYTDMAKRLAAILES